MKARIPGELDQLMWMLAEEGDSGAVAEFEARHPEHRYELARRVAMVRGFKSEGARVHRQAPPLRFQPRQAQRATPPPRLLYAVGALCLAAVAAATYTATLFLQPAPPVTAPRPVLVAQKPAPVVTQPPPETIFPPTVTPLAKEPEPTPTVVPAYLKPQNMQVESAPLLTALEMIGAQGQIRLTIGPGMPNPSVRFTFRERTTLEMLEKLGQAYGFTAFDQGDGTILVIPATDPKEQKLNASQTDPQASTNERVEKSRPQDGVDQP